MIIKINTLQDILVLLVHGKNDECCGSELNSCRFFDVVNDKCILFSIKLKCDSDVYDFIRCEECKRSEK